MPVLSRFLGIQIKMYYRDHLPPHFHARYGDQMIAVEIETGVVRGQVSPRVLGLVLEWRALRLQELRLAWDAVQAGVAPPPITGLE